MLGEGKLAPAEGGCCGRVGEGGGEGIPGARSESFGWKRVDQEVDWAQEQDGTGHCSAG